MNISKITILFSIIFSTIIYGTEIDPFQEINEKTHNFNLVLDKQLATPVARIYKKVTPDLVEKSITNFTHNIEDLSIAINNILQGKINNGVSDLLRFTINSSLGVLGFFDVASNLGFEKHDEDFGQTLAIWGIGSGPYIVLPGLGPSNLRDTLSMLPDAFLTPLYVIDHDRTSYSLTAIDIVETRARYLGLESVVIGDDYLFYRDAYLQSREFDILDGEVSEEFDEFDDFD
jgi:phospholipid-binding lipoprotein MlaA|tara:strand:+ start:636 stop:1328 length:693 start_codon:yes stop_codon:yes gene_type:complete